MAARQANDAPISSNNANTENNHPPATFTGSGHPLVRRSEGMIIGKSKPFRSTPAVELAGVHEVRGDDSRAPIYLAVQTKQQTNGGMGGLN
jgi:hypothetical protein